MTCSFFRAVSLSLLFLLACASPAEQSEHDANVVRVGTLEASLELGSGSVHDVVAFRLDITASDSCDEDVVDSRVVALAPSSLPGYVRPEGAGSDHPLGSRFLVLAAGSYTVCVTPLDEDGEPSEYCTADHASVQVEAEETSQVFLLSNCDTEGLAGASIAAALNTRPVIVGVSAEDERFVNICNSTTIVADTDDADGDELTFEWTVESTPKGATAVLDADAEEAVFRGSVEGKYVIRVSVSDPFGARASLSLPLFVSGTCDEAGVTCSAGSEPADDGTCRLCAVGTYSEEGTACRPCLPGTAVPVRGAASCLVCPAGSFASERGAGECELCPPGAASEAGSDICTECGAGRFAHGLGSAACLDCPAGATSEAGASECTACASGSFNDSAASDVCSRCPGGTYQPHEGGTSCQPCPFGTISSEGATECSCPAEDCGVTYQWRVSLWGACSEDCGGGEQIRLVECVSSRGIVAPNSHCADQARPAAVGACNMQTCETHAWIAGDWIECSAACGGGESVRDVKCVSSKGVVAVAALCADVMPEVQRACGETPCYKWRPASWSECRPSVGGDGTGVESPSDGGPTGGGGTPSQVDAGASFGGPSGEQERAVNCIEIQTGLLADDFLCGLPQPPNIQGCEL